MTSAPRGPLDRGAAVLGLLTVGVANLLYLTGLPRILDPMLSMEPFYIHMAQQPVGEILAGDPAWGPLYAVWLKPFRAALGDPLAVCAANVYGLSLGVSLLIFLYLLLLTRRAAVGVGAALFFLISDLNVPLASKVSDFALMLILAGLALSELVPAGAARTTVAAVGVLLASYARPELYPAALCLAIAAVWSGRRQWRSGDRRAAWWPAAGLALILVAAVWIGTPVFSPSHPGDRLLVAFREHFAWNWGKWHDHQWRYYLAVWEAEFGGARTMLEALRTNPTAVFHHLGDNALGTLRFMTVTAFDHYPLLAPVTSPALVAIEAALASAAVFGSLLVVAARAGMRRAMHDRYGHVLLPYAVIAVFALGGATVIYPLAHYLVAPAVLLLLAGTLAATVIVPAPATSRWVGVVAALACLVAVPKPFVLPSDYVVPDSPFKGRITVARKVTDTIEFVRALGLPSPVQVLTLTDGMGELLGARFNEVKIWQKGTQPLQDYLRDRHVDLIISMEAGRNSFVVDDAYWTLIQTTPEAAGFTRLTVPSQPAVRLYARTGLVPAPGR